MQEKLRISVRSKDVKISQSNTIILDSNNVRKSNVHKGKVSEVWKQQYANRKKKGWRERRKMESREKAENIIPNKNITKLLQK